MGAFIVFVLAIENGRSYWVAIPVALVFSFVLGAALERTLIRPIERRSALGVVIVTLGIFLIINALNAAIWGTQQLPPLAPFPNFPEDQFVLAEGPPRFAVRYGAIGTWVTLALVVAVLWFFFQKTKLGLGYRAVASNRESSQLVGVPVGRMLMLGWAISAVLGTIAAIMVSQSTNTLDFNLMAVVLLYGFAAAALGRLRQHPGRRGRRAHRRHGRGVHPVVLQLRRVELSLAVALGVIVVVLLVRPEGSVRHEEDRARMSWPIIIDKGSPKHRLWQVVGYATARGRDLLDRLPLRELPDPELRAGRRRRRRDPRPDDHHRLQRPGLDRPELLLRSRRLRHGLARRRPRLELPADAPGLGRDRHG